MNSKTEKMLMSVVTYSEIYEEGKFKNNYDILQQFIMYILIKDNMIDITEVEVKEKLKDRFEFVNLPFAIIDKTLQNMCNSGLLEITKNISGNSYRVNKERISSEFLNNEIEKYEDQVKENLKIIKSELGQYFKELYGKEITDSDYDEIINKYNNFIKDSVKCDDTNSEISKFIVCCNEKVRGLVQQNINAYIIFEGLNYDIVNTELKITNDVKLFLDMEILFDISGYNGDYHRKRGMEMLKYISEINKIRNRTIQLYYLPITKNYIEDFFRRAEKIKFENAVDYRMNTAMEYIHDKCDNKSDVKLLEKSFFNCLNKQYNIKEDSEDYYSEQYVKYNLDKQFYDVESYKTLNDDNKYTEKIEEAIKYFDVIIKQRANVKSNNFFDCKALFVTETNKYKELSRYLTSEEGYLSNCYKLSISMNEVTNVLWLKLGKGLGNINSANSNDAMMLAKMIIAKNNTKRLNDSCKEAKMKMDNNEIDNDAYKEFIAELRTNKELMFPENITSENVNIDFDNITEIESSKRYDKIEKERLNCELLDAKEELKNAREELEIYRKRDEDEKRIKSIEADKRMRRNKILRRARFVCLVLFVVGIVCILMHFCPLFFTIFTTLTGIASLISLIITIIDKRKHKGE